MLRIHIISLSTLEFAVNNPLICFCCFIFMFFLSVSCVCLCEILHGPTHFKHTEFLQKVKCKCLTFLTWHHDLICVKQNTY
ncbi:hypothetical protein MtrunA17_Chr3g0141771 [Medicago truncatula]|uniref:Transmembrane protein n=1 Tax=Medicago truncatula TaxID=3880 RepID=A0A396J2U9_MEDTR|nr:hypothetical protein MtrunA17_Chr3g0141771 [Medicago truncatula]